jgi:general L-amino acid transport system permease protein
MVCTTEIAGGLQHDGWHGACWPLATAKIKFLTYGAYPSAELWRVNITGLVVDCWAGLSDV